MTKVITYGTYDLLHYGHIRLLERAKALGDYLIVGVTSDDYDRTRGKINNQQSFMERVAAVKATGIADEVIAEEYEGQKIDDIRRLNVDIFTVGSDWEGKFDYLNEYCKVVYLQRTEGVSSTELRSEKARLRIGLFGEEGSEITSLPKFCREARFVNGIEICYSNIPMPEIEYHRDINWILDRVDAVYIASHPSRHYEDVRLSLMAGKHVLCESPVSLKKSQTMELQSLAREKGCILMEGIKTAYTTAFERLVLLSKTGKIGKVLSVDAVCTSLKKMDKYGPEDIGSNWNTITEWGPVALLPVFKILGTDYESRQIYTKYLNKEKNFDAFTKMDFRYKNAVASIKVAKGAKSEGELVITGTEGYIYVPAPWWKTDYFEIRYEDSTENKRYFYQLDGEGIRYEMVAFVKAVETGKTLSLIDDDFSSSISGILEDYYEEKDIHEIV